MIDIFNFVISAIGAFISIFIDILPNSPFQFISSIDNNFISVMNFIFPFNQVIALLQIYLPAVLIYYGVRVVLNWLKVAST